MNPAELLAPTSPLGAPAPYWLLVFFKVLGFTLHMLPMHLWAAGLVVGLVLRARGGATGQLWASRLAKQMPLFIALGVNFGIVPLLFLQVAYHRVFYAATILMAWPWLSVIALLTLAYYGVYAYAAGLRRARLDAWRQAAGWIAAGCFTVIGFLFANAMSLMTRLEAWPTAWDGARAGGATFGLALDRGDASLWPRWLMLLGLALTTTAVHMVADAGIFARRDETYRRWAGRFALRLHTVGLAWFAACGAWYVFGTWPSGVRGSMLSGPLSALTLLTAAGPGLVWVLLFVQRHGVTRRFAWGTAAAQLGVLALNAVSRQIVQNLELRRWYDVTAEPVRTQWSPLVVFLLVFGGGVVLIVWMVRKAVAAARGHLAADPLAAEIDIH